MEDINQILASLCADVPVPPENQRKITHNQPAPVNYTQALIRAAMAEFLNDHRREILNIVRRKIRQAQRKQEKADKKRKQQEAKNESSSTKKFSQLP